jgi:AraC-like DNA-binding protein
VADRKNASPATSTAAGVLRPDELVKHVQVDRMPCADALAPWVENYWMLRWDLPEGATYVSRTLPHPACTLGVERGHLRAGVEEAEPVVVTGVLTRRFDVTIQDQGWVFGVKFRPGGLASLTGLSARPLRDQTVAASGIFSAATVKSLRELGPHLSGAECQHYVDDLLTGLVRTPEPAYERLLDVVSTMLEDRTLVRVGQVEERCGIEKRRLQRLFERYVGATPKWTLARYRIHDAVSDLDAGYDGSLADLAAHYGWFDQAHFTREFTELVGVPPRTYQRHSSNA